MYAGTVTFAKSGRYHDCDAYTVFATFVNNLRYGTGRCGDDGQVNVFIDGMNRRITTLAIQLFVLGINGINGSGKTRIEQILIKAGTHGIFPRTGAKHGYGFG